MSPDASPADQERDRLEGAIAALEAQRSTIAESVLDAAIAPLQARLAALEQATRDQDPRALRHVTIVFVDVVGSTRLSERLDPEDTHAVMKGALARFTTIVEHHGGRVLQYTGDGLLAAFGVERTNEDDAERGVRAGLALLAEGRLQADTVRRIYRADDFDVRVGAHSGVVLIGDAIDAARSIGGVAVNIAARMEQTAPAGALRISRDTWRQVRDRFDVEQQPPLDVKGLAQPVVSFLVLREKPRTFAPVRGSEPGVLLGRDAEIAQILGVIDATLADRTLRTFTVIGDAGLGKSRLVHEIEVRMPSDRGVPLHGSAHAHGLDDPYGVVRDLLAWHCDIVDSDDRAVARDKLTACFASVFGDRVDERSALVGQLIGMDFSQDPHIVGIVRDGPQVRSRAFHAIGQYLGALSDRHGAAILLLDDVHWADAGSLDLIDHLATHCSSSAIVIGCFARPVLLERRPDWGRARRTHLRIDLSPLGDDSSAQLVAALLPQAAVATDDVRGLVLEHAEGNPFHIQELLGMLIDDGVVIAKPDGWRVDRERLLRTKVPTTLTAILQARLDALPAAEKRALQRESVIGSIFWDAALHAIEPSALVALDPLRERDLIRKRPESTFVGTREFEFKHHLLHQVTYDTVLKEVKRDLHQKTGDWLVSATGSRIGEHLGLIAEHYERAANSGAASRYLLRAADAAYWTGAFAAARAYLDRAFALADLDAHVRFEMHFTSNHLNNATGRRSEQVADTAALTALAESIDDDALRARAWRQQIPLHLLAGDPQQAFEIAQRTERLADRVGDLVTRVGAMIEGAQGLIALGRLDEASAALEAALPLSRTTDRRDLESIAHGRLEMIASARGDFDAGRLHLEAGLAIDRSLGNRRWEASSIGNLAVLEYRLGNLDRARALSIQSLETHRAIGNRGGEPYPLDTLGMIDLESGLPHEAMARLNEALRLVREAGDRFGERMVLADLADCHAALGETEAALACLDRYAKAGQPATPGSVADVIKVSVLLDAGRLDDAASIVAPMITLVDGPASVAGDADARLLFVCHRYLAATHDARARSLLARAHAVLLRQTHRMSDEDRAAYVMNLRLHRDIVAAWSTVADA